MDCPRCHISLSPKEYEHLSVYTCKKCSGIWLTPPQLSKITTLRIEQFSPKEIQDTLKHAYSGVPIENILTCPVCSQAMEEINYDYSSGVIINSCPHCDGLWFDKHELEVVEIFMEHWDDEENKNKNIYLEDLRKTQADFLNKEKLESQREKAHIAALSREGIIKRLFLLFDSMKMDK